MSHADPRMRRLALIATLAVLLAVAGASFWAWTPDLDRATLEARWLRAPADMVEVAGTPLHVRDDGPRDAPAILLLHGFGASLHGWEPWARELARTWRVVRFDLPGFGLSPPDASGDYTDARSRALVSGVMDRLGLARATLVGHSMGGRIAWSFAAHEPARVERLVLIAPDGFASEGFRYGEAPRVPAVARVVTVALPRAMVRSSLKSAYVDEGALRDEQVGRYHDLLRAPGARQAILDRMAQLRLEDPVPLLRRIQAPTLLLWGEQDRMIPMSNARDYLEAMPDARLVALPRLGHLPHEEDPERALAPLRAFLEAGSP